jgi:Protein of unknown function (DUF1573)
MKLLSLIWLSLAMFASAAALEFKETQIDVHPTAAANAVSVDFEFTNHSGKPVTIREYKPSCVCMTLQIKGGKLQYAPGESGMIRADFDLMNFSGIVNKDALVWLDQDPEGKPSVRLTVRAHIPALISLSPKTLTWELDGAAAPQTIRITTHHDKPIHVTEVKSNSPLFKHELKTIKDGSSYELIVTPLDIKVGGIGMFKIFTDCEIPKHQTQQAFSVIRKRMDAKIVAKP